MSQIDHITAGSSGAEQVDLVGTDGFIRVFEDGVRPAGAALAISTERPHLTNGHRLYWSDRVQAVRPAGIATDDAYIYLGYIKMAYVPGAGLFSYNVGEHSAERLVSCIISSASSPIFL